MNELDRRIAVEIMGEEEPLLPDNAKDLMPMGSFSILHASDGDNWSLRCGHVFHEETRYMETVPEWQPLPFSSNLEYAMKAVDKWFSGKEFNGYRLQVKYWPESAHGDWLAWTGMLNTPYVPGTTLPEAICNLLLALKEKP